MYMFMYMYIQVGGQFASPSVSATKSLMVLPSPFPKPIRHARHQGTPFGDRGCVGFRCRRKSSDASQPVNL